MRNANHHFSFLSYSVGNFFAECMGGLEDSIVRSEKYPTRSQQLYFCQHYHETYNKNKLLSQDEIEKLADEANQFSLVAHLYWALWGLCQSVTSKVDFDYVLFARNRMKEYKRVKLRYLYPDRNLEKEALN